ncbi:hypothetical protein D0862_01462 [Hortaea werneckii]|uniref:DUF6590 domain-containing protein n=1 Tax=Hortaea werneckii TaxID=91943 RepID=A0A3M7HRB1_HORWE|nr:hypothetical protein D0862_01462 [Hortaea werneckii]
MQAGLVNTEGHEDGDILKVYLAKTALRMSQLQGQQNPTSWSWDARRQSYYYYSPEGDAVVYQDGLRVPRPLTIPREVLNNQAVDISIPQPRFDRLRLDSYDRPSNSSYKTPGNPTRFFVPGKVFLALWATPADASASTRSTVFTRSYLEGTGLQAFSRVRRFIVVRSSPGYCSAIPIATYGGKGVSKPGANKNEHCIIYTGAHVPNPLPKELPSRGEPPMQPIPIRVIPDNVAEKLDPTSRVDFGRVETIQYNIKVKAFGIVHGGSMQALHWQFCAVWRLPLTGAHTPSALGRLQQTPRSGIYDEAGNEATDDEDDETSEDDDGSNGDVDGPEGKAGGESDMVRGPYSDVESGRMGELIGALRCCGFASDVVTRIAGARTGDERATVVSQMHKESRRAKEMTDVRVSKVREVAFEALRRKGYSEGQAEFLLKSQLG